MERTTNDGGEFALDLTSPSRPESPWGWVCIYAPGYAVAGGPLKAGENVFQLAPAGQAWGSVADEAGRPVAGARVSVQAIGPAGPSRGPYVPINGSIKDDVSALTTADGRWVIEHMPTSGTASVVLDDPRFCFASARVELGPAATSSRPLIAIPGATITGRVIREGGGSVEGTSVFARGQSAEQGGSSSAAAPDGSYSLTRLAAGKYTIMADDPSGRGVAVARQGVTVKTAEVVTVPDLTLIRGALIEGTVTNVDTALPIADVMVGSEGPHRPSATGFAATTRTDAAGKYRMRVSPGASRVFVVSVPEGYLRGVDRVGVNLQVGETRQVPFLLRKGLTLNGQVVNERGAPAPEAQVEIGGTSENGDSELHVTTGADGRFTLNPLGLGKHYLRGEGDWQVVSPMEVRLPLSGNLKIVVRKLVPVSLTGQVVTTQSLPIAGVNIQAMVIAPIAEGVGRGENFDLTTDAQGRFSISQVRPDATVQITATKEGYTFASGGQVEKKNGALQVADIVLAPLKNSFSGVVVDAHGNPAAGARVMSPEAVPGPWVVTDVNGHFTVQGVASGEAHTLAVQGGFFGETRATIPGASPTVRLEAMKPAGDQDLVRGFAVLAEVERKSQGKDYYARESLPTELAPYDPDLALRLVPDTKGPEHDYALAGVIFTLAQTESTRALAWGSPRLAQINDPTTRSIALSALGLAAAESNPNAARDLYRQLKNLLGPVASGPGNPICAHESESAGGAGRSAQRPGGGRDAHELDHGHQGRGGETSGPGPRADGGRRRGGGERHSGARRTRPLAAADLAPSRMSAVQARAVGSLALI